MKSKTLVKAIFTLIILLSTSILNAQNNRKIDSLHIVLKEKTLNESRYEILLELSNQYLYNNVDSCSKYAQEIIDIAKEKDEINWLAKAENNIGGANCISGNLSSALIHLLKAKKYFKLDKNKEGEIGSILNLGVIYSMQENNIQAMENYKIAFNYFNETNNRENINNTAYNLASILIDISEFDEAQYYISILEKDKNITNDFPIHSLKASYHLKKENLDSAYIYYKRQHDITKSDNDYDEIYCLMGLGEVFTKQKKYSSALNYYDLAKTIALQNHYESDLVTIYEKCTLIYDSIKNYKAAYKCNIKHQDLVASINKKEKKEELNELLTKYQTEKLQHETIHQKELLATEETLRESKEFRLKLLAIFTIITLGGFTLYTYVKRKSHKKLNFQKTYIENQQSKILKSINYAKRIQDSILKPQSEVSVIFPTSFVYFKPKAIVSGDFYWMKEFGKIKVVATVDCIGHGVPGAFMSLIINNLLEKYVQPKHLENPGTILTKIHQHLINESKLNPDQQGMDMSISIINEQKRTLSFSGARNSAFIYNRGDFKTLTASPYSVGSDFKIAPKYQSEVYNIQENDKLYMYTDGFIDQFGGKKSKKLNTKKFKELISELEHIVITDVQSHIQTYLKAWQGELSQTDDILIFGIKF